MGRDRSRGSKAAKSRKVDIRDPRQTLPERDLLTFSFKDLDQTQPKGRCETIESWGEKGLLPQLLGRLVELSKLTRDEACNQQQVKIYPGGFPPKDKTEFVVPLHVDEHVAWGVIENIGGKVRVAGYLSGNTFYIVFLDSEHKFYISSKKHT